MGLLLPHRWPLTYSQWWECDFVTEGIIDSGENSPLVSHVLGCSSVGVYAVPAAMGAAAPCSANMRSFLYLPYPTSAAAAAPGREAAWPDTVAQCLALVCQALTILCPPCRWWLSGQPDRCVRGTVSQLQRCPRAPAVLCAHLQSGLASHSLPVQARGVSQQSQGC